MDSNRGSESLVVNFPKSSLDLRGEDWDLFKSAYIEKIESLINIATDRVRNNSKNSQGGCIEVIYSGWLSYRQFLINRKEPPFIIDEKINELALNLFGLATLYTEPKKPAGVGSKSNDSEYPDDVLKPLEKLVLDSEALLNRFNQNDWVPEFLKLELYKGNSSIQNVLTEINKMIKFDKQRPYREQIYFEHLTQLFNDNKSVAGKVIDDFIFALQERRIEVFKNAEKWRGRLKGMNKKMPPFLESATASVTEVPLQNLLEL